MSWKNLSQYGLADALLSKHDSLKELDDVHQIIDWPEIEGLLSPLYSSKRGKPAFPPDPLSYGKARITVIVGTNIEKNMVEYLGTITSVGHLITISISKVISKIILLGNTITLHGVLQ